MLTTVLLATCGAARPFCDVLGRSRGALTGLVSAAIVRACLSVQNIKQALSYQYKVSHAMVGKLRLNLLHKLVRIETIARLCLSPRPCAPHPVTIYDQQHSTPNPRLRTLRVRVM